MTNIILLITASVLFGAAMHYREAEATVVFTWFLIWVLRRIYRAIRQNAKHHALRGKVNKLEGDA